MNDNMSKIAIIDYGVGNMLNVEKAVRIFSSNVSVTNNSEEIIDASAIILPGVGSFKSGMEGLRKYGLVRNIKKFAESGKPILGICLGAQLLLSSGFEMGETEGLDLISGEVNCFPKLPSPCKIPNIGWRSVSLEPEAKNNPVLQSIDSSREMYFVHSYVIIPENKKNILASSAYGGYKFCAIVGKDNIFGTQFHPERSGKEGLNFIENFVNLTK